MAKIYQYNKFWDLRSTVVYYQKISFRGIVFLMEVTSDFMLPVVENNKKYSNKKVYEIF